MVKVTQLCDSEGNTALIAALCQEKHRHGSCFFPAVAAEMFGLCSLHSLKGALWAVSQLGFSHCGARPEASTPNTLPFSADKPVFLASCCIGKKSRVNNVCGFIHF